MRAGNRYSKNVSPAATPGSALRVRGSDWAATNTSNRITHNSCDSRMKFTPCVRGILSRNLCVLDLVRFIPTNRESGRFEPLMINMITQCRCISSMEFIPARIGNRNSKTLSEMTGTVQSRMCRVQLSAMFLSARAIGSSPRVRRIFIFSILLF